jgi:acetyl esterase/lipase
VSRFGSAFRITLVKHKKIVSRAPPLRGGSFSFGERGVNLVAPVVGTKEENLTLNLERKHPLIPRRMFFGNPDKTDVELSRDGNQISFLAPLDGVLNIWVAPVEDIDAARPITSARRPGIRSHFWAHTHQHIIYIRDEKGDERWQVHSVNLHTKRDLNLSHSDKKPGQQEMLAGGKGKQRGEARVERVSAKIPFEILIGLNNRDLGRHDLYRVNIETGRKTCVKLNYIFERFVIDDDYDIRLAIRHLDGDKEVLKSSREGRWEHLLKIPWEDWFTTELQGLDSAGRKIYLRDSRGCNEPVLKSIDLTTGREEILNEADEASSIGWDKEYLESLSLRGRPRIVSQSSDGNRWLVTYDSDLEPGRYYLYERIKRRATFLFATRPALSNVVLAKMHELKIRVRDELELSCYLTLPSWIGDPADLRPPSPLPMVLVVHGGPHARDYWGYDPDHQWLANRGYAVLSVNFRGSTGFGKRILNAGRCLWGGAMQDDLVDATEWAVEQGVADEARIAIMGGSYGGYAALCGLAFTPEIFSCGVDLVGCSDLTNGEHFAKPVNVEEREALENRSPLFRANRIRKPLLIGHGANDPRVKQKESDHMVRAMQAHDLPVTYVLYPDEGHGFVRPENRLSFKAITEAFLARHLGGRLQPIDHDLPGSSFELRALGIGMASLKSYWDVMTAIHEAKRRRSACLDLSAKKLAVLPPEIGKLKSLRRLHLSGNQLSFVPRELAELSCLEELQLDRNCLISLPSEIGQLGRLKILHLDNNRIEMLPPEIGRLTSLKLLTLRKNQLLTLPPEIGLLYQLEELDLRSNQLLFLPCQMSKLKTLTGLYLNGNHFVEQAVEIRRLSKLLRLDVKQNRLDYFSRGLPLCESAGNPMESPSVGCATDKVA